MGKSSKINEADWTGTLKNDLVNNWADFVNCSKRLETEGPFLDKLIEYYDNPCVLDAAMGIGCETIYLKKRGTNIIANEIDPDLCNIAIQNATNHGVNIDITSHDWRNLESGFGVDAFDVVFILGNSLCLLRENQRRLDTALNFRKVCRNGGTVIVDQRNFKYILENRKEILNGNYHYSGKVMYCGESIKGYPISINDDCIRFLYENINTGQKLGYLDMHPFRTGELISLFAEVGFAHVDIYSDLVLGFNDSADFYTFVFR